MEAKTLTTEELAMVSTKDVTDLSRSVDALVEKYGKLSGTASAEAKAKLLAKAGELREALEQAAKDLPPAVGRGVDATKSAAAAAKGAFAADIVPVAIAALSTALEVISEKSAQAKGALSSSAESVAPPTPRKKSRSWLGIIAIPVVAGVATAVAFAVFGSTDEKWIPVEDDLQDIIPS